MKKTFRFLTIFLSIILVFSFTGCKDNSEKDKEIAPENPISNTVKIQYETFDELEFYYLYNMSIPKNWHKEKRDNGFVLIEPRSGTELYFIIEEYYPTINNMTYDTAKAYLTNDTHNFISFKKSSGNELFFKYEQIINGKKFIVCETQKFNFKYSYTVKMICEEVNFNDYSPAFDKMSSSLHFPASYTTIPEGFDGFYHPNACALTVYPRSWETTTSSDYFTSKIANTSLTVTYAATIKNFTGMNQATYNNVMQKTVSNFSTSAFANSGTVVQAEGYYTNNSIKYIVYNTIYNFENFSINIIYVSPENEFSTYANAYATVVKSVYLQK